MSHNNVEGHFEIQSVTQDIQQGNFETYREEVIKPLEPHQVACSD